MIIRDLDNKTLEVILKPDGTFNSSRIKSTYIKDNYPDLYVYLGQRFDDLSISNNFKEIIFRLKEKIEETPKCVVCGEKVKFDGRRYTTFCSKECQKSNDGKKYLADKIEKTNVKRYGVKCTFQTEEIKNKVKETCFERYGVYHPMQNGEISKKTVEKLKNKTTEEKKEIIKKIKQTKKEKYGDENFVNPEKAVQTNIQRYGTKNPSQNGFIKEKIEKTCLETYGCKSPLSSDLVKNKIKQTCLKKYGVEYITQTDFQKEKSKKTCLEKYGFDYAFKNKKIRDKANNTNLEKYGDKNYRNRTKVIQTNLSRYGVENPSQNEEIKRKIKTTNLVRYGTENVMHSELVKSKFKKSIFEKYGVENPMQNPKINEKQWVTRRIKNTLVTSSVEENFQKFLVGRNIVFERNYNKDRRYPYHVDFYIEKYDLFIEIQGLWTHGGHAFDETNEDDLILLNKWKTHNSKYYKNAIEVWTKRDVEKRETAFKNKLNYLEVFSNDVNDVIDSFENFIGKHDK